MLQDDDDVVNDKRIYYNYICNLNEGSDGCWSFRMSDADFAIRSFAFQGKDGREWSQKLAS